MPAASEGGDEYVGTFFDGEDRNYTYLYDKSMYTSLWTAYPLYSSTVGSGRESSWNPNPDFDKSEQINIWDSSYGVDYGSTIYSRGHQIPNGDRNGNSTMLKHTFYATNSVPQIQDGFNGGIWATVEDQIRGQIPGRDTLYVVTGVSFNKVGGSETITYIQPKSDTKKCPVPNYFWKVILKVKRSGDTLTAAESVGFWFEHKQYNGTGFDSYTVSVKDIEAWTGFDFFVNLPDELESDAESNKSWTTFKNF